MKKKLILNFFLVVSFRTAAIDRYPLTLVVHNDTKEPLLMSIEYELDQHYTRDQGPGTPFVPNNTEYHFLSTIPAGQKQNVPVFAFHPCAKQFCFLDSNLRKYGFREHYKVIQGSVTVQKRKRSYNFKEAVFDGSVITCTVGEKNKFTVHSTHGFAAMQNCYKTGNCNS